jgi:uncharacterized protein YjgD (DUF1641 family)
MARPITLEVPARDPRKELLARLENAPMEHAEALLDSYELLQELHDKRIFTLLRGALSAGDKIIEDAVNVAQAPESVRAMRNLIILSKMLGSIEPELLRSVAVAVSETVGNESRASLADPPGFFTLLSQFRQSGVRRSIALANRFLNSLGRQLSAKGAEGSLR